MSARSTALQIAAKAGMLLGALFVFTILLAAWAAERGPAQEATTQESAAQAPDVDHSNMPGMDMSDEHANEKAAVHDMTPGHHDALSQHMTTTAMRAQTPADVQRANEVVAQLRAASRKNPINTWHLNNASKIFFPTFPNPDFTFTTNATGF